MPTGNGDGGDCSTGEDRRGQESTVVYSSVQQRTVAYSRDLGITDLLEMISCGLWIYHTVETFW